VLHQHEEDGDGAQAVERTDVAISAPLPQLGTLGVC
jgi:hypothetical protein